MANLRGTRSDVWFHDDLPDFDDDATRGCLLRLVRDAWSCPTLHVMFNFGWYVDGDPRLWGLDRHAAESTALLAALLAAPENPNG